MESFISPSHNSSVESTKTMDIYQMIQQPIAILLTVFGILGNIINIVVIPRLSITILNEASKVAFIALAITDLITSSSLLVNSVVVSKREWIRRTNSGAIFCDVSGFISTLGIFTGACFILLINVDRYVHITRPLTYQVIVTRRRAVIATLLIISYTLFIGFLFIGLKGGDAFIYQPEANLCVPSFHDPSLLPYTISLFTFTLCLMVGLLLAIYGRIIYITRRHMRMISAQLGSVNRVVGNIVPPLDSGHDADGIHIVQLNANIEDRERERKRQVLRRQDSLRRGLRSLRLPLLVTGCFLMTFLPSIIVVTLASAAGMAVAKPIWVVCVISMASNSANNTFVYIFGKKEFREEFRKIICRLRSELA